MKKLLYTCSLIILMGCHKKYVSYNEDMMNAAEQLLASSQAPLKVTGNAYFFGDSITQGWNGSQVIVNNWVNLVAGFTGLTASNFGVGGTTLEMSSTYLYQLSMYKRASTDISVKTASDKYLFFAYGTNDVINVIPDFNVDQFAIQYQYVLNIAFAKGWKPQDIVLVNIYYMNAASYPTSVGLTNQSATDRTNSFNDVIKNIALKNNTRLIDIRSYMETYGADYLICPDGIHPSDVGHAVIARGIEEALRGFQ